MIWWAEKLWDDEQDPLEGCKEEEVRLTEEERLLRDSERIVQAEVAFLSIWNTLAKPGPRIGRIDLGFYHQNPKSRKIQVLNLIISDQQKTPWYPQNWVIFAILGVWKIAFLVPKMKMQDHFHRPNNLPKTGKNHLGTHFCHLKVVYGHFIYFCPVFRV